ncbi:MAG: SDR family NAD(P)-dependent oxidoreductase, partial [Pseudomonadota bacterium]
MVLKDKVAIVTGASKGIGKGIAQRFSREGATVVLASRSLDSLVSLAEEIEAAGGRAMALAADVRDAQSLESMVQRAAQELGSVDIMVNNAG